MSINDVLLTSVILVALLCFIIVILRDVVGSNRHINKKPIETDMETDKYTYSIMKPAGAMAVISIHQTGDPGAIPYGWVMITGHDDCPKECILWMVYIREKYRGNGFAKALIGMLQTKYDRIVTQYERGIINSAGVRLCISCGFDLKRQMFKNVPADLIWTKKGK